MHRTFTIGQLAAEAGVNVETIRYYQRRKLIREPLRCSGETRRYARQDAERLRFIKRAQRAGFTLRESEELLRLLAPRSCSQTRALAATKLEALDDQVRELQQLREDLAGLVAECDANADPTRCPIIDRFCHE